MIEIIPAILTDDSKKFLEVATRFVSAGVKRVHLDIGDGEFISKKTISGFKEIIDANLPIDWDIHLMVNRPEDFINSWWEVARAKRFLVHIESTKMFEMLSGCIHEHDKLIGASINPDTDLSILKDAIPNSDSVQFMTVVPGKQGGVFMPEVLEHVKEIHSLYPDIDISVDGGVTPETASLCVAAGANILVSGSYIERSTNVENAIKEIQSSVTDSIEHDAVVK